MIVYKVVNKDRKSIIMKGEMALSFPVGEKVKPKHRDCPILAFSDKKQCLRFIDRHKLSIKKNYLIIKCEAVVSKRQSIMILSGLISRRDVTKEDCVKAWKGECGFWDSFDPTNTYEGTVICSSITPLE